MSLIGIEKVSKFDTLKIKKSCKNVLKYVKNYIYDTYVYMISNLPNRIYELIVIGIEID